jgi:beta-phosphoglucomutase
MLELLCYDPVEMSLSPGLALIFDLDGVIVDSMPLHTVAWNAYLARFDIRCGNLEQRMLGRRNDEIVRDFFGNHLSPDEIFRHGAAKERLFREMMGTRLPAYLVPGVVPFIERYRAAPLAVASNAEPANIEFTLNGAGLRSSFKVVVDGMQVKHPKPYPDVYLKAADELGILPKNCIVFEDSPTGVQAARAAGARVVGVETHDKLDEVNFKIADFREPELDRWLTSQEPA